MLPAQAGQWRRWGRRQTRPDTRLASAARMFFWPCPSDTTPPPTPSAPLCSLLRFVFESVRKCQRHEEWAEVGVVWLGSNAREFLLPFSLLSNASRWIRSISFLQLFLWLRLRLLFFFFFFSLHCPPLFPLCPPALAPFTSALPPPAFHPSSKASQKGVKNVLRLNSPAP